MGYLFGNNALQQTTTKSQCIQQEQFVAYEYGVSWRHSHVGRLVCRPRLALARVTSIILFWSTSLSSPNRRAQSVFLRMTGMREQAKMHKAFGVLDLEVTHCQLCHILLPKVSNKAAQTESTCGERNSTSAVRGTVVIQPRTRILGGVMNWRWYCCLSHLHWKRGQLSETLSIEQWDSCTLWALASNLIPPRQCKNSSPEKLGDPRGN